MVSNNMSREIQTYTENDGTRKKAWQPAQLRCLGHVTGIVQGGGGKLSQIGGDPGENRKQQGGGG